jgi:hypothetical protein
MLKRILARWKLLLAILILLPLVLLGIAQWMLHRLLTPTSLVARMEESLNCRVELTSASANIWSLPATVSLNGLKLAPRDADADSGKALDQRQPLNPKTVVMTLEQANLQVDLWSLISGNLNIHDLLLKNVNVTSNTTADGTNSLSALFGKPATVAGKPNPKLEKEIKLPTVGKPAAPNEGHPFNVRDLPVASALRGAKVEGVSIEFKSDQRKEIFRFENAGLSLNDVQFDPAALGNKNHATLDLRSKFIIISKRKLDEINPATGKQVIERFEQANLGIALNGSFSPFDPKTGNLAGIPFALSLEKDSTLNEVVAIQRISQKMKRWERYGLSFAPLPDEVVMTETSKVNMIYEQPKLTVASDLILKFDNYELILHQGSWLDLASNQCKFEIEIIGSKSVSDQAVKDFTGSLIKKVGEGVGATLGSKVTQLFTKEKLILPDGRLSVPMGLTGDIGKPEVEDRVTPILENALLNLIVGGLN